VAVMGASSVALGDAVIRENSPHGLHLMDTSVAAFNGGNEITGNSGYGILCDPAPAVAQAFGNPGTVSGNSAGEISCPGLMVP
jgi:hypothetical protein